MKKQTTLILSLLAVICLLNPAFAQDPEQPLREDGVCLARILKSPGAVLVRESHELDRIVPVNGETIKSEILIVRRLLDPSTENEDCCAGLVFEIEEKHQIRRISLEGDEINAFLAALALLEKEGEKIMTSPKLTLPEELSHDMEVHFLTREGLMLGVFASGDSWKYAVKTSAVSDWSFLNKTAMKTLVENLKVAKQVIEALGPKDAGEAAVGQQEPAPADSGGLPETGEE